MRSIVNTVRGSLRVKARSVDVTFSVAAWIAVAIVLLIATTPPARAQVFTQFYNFSGADGAYPWDALVQSSDGNFYGNTFGGGSSGMGTVFRVTPEAGLRTLHSFGGADGANPVGTVLAAADGSLYGTASYGGANEAGTIFRIAPDGTFTKLHDFTGADGNDPESGLVEDRRGNLYGTTALGGKYGSGSVFVFSARGRLKTLYNFCQESGCSDGAHPYASLLRTVTGDLFGTTYDGGSSAYGTIFKITPQGQFSTVHSFSGTDGSHPVSGLIEGTDGNYYGTTISGFYGAGTIFRITPSGTLTTLANLSGSQGAKPYAPLVQASDGFFYGTTVAGGSHSYGSIYRVSSAGTLTPLYDFCAQSDCTDGSYPEAAMIQGADGNLYGTTNGGGAYASGEIFRFSPPPSVPTAKQ